MADEQGRQDGAAAQGGQPSRPSPDGAGRRRRALAVFVGCPGATWFTLMLLGSYPIDLKGFAVALGWSGAAVAAMAALHATRTGVSAGAFLLAAVASAALAVLAFGAAAGIAGDSLGGGAEGGWWVLSEFPGALVLVVSLMVGIGRVLSDDSQSRARKRRLSIAKRDRTG